MWTAEKAEDKSETDDNTDKFRYVSHFGERFAGRRSPSLFLMQWNNNDFSKKGTLYKLHIPHHENLGVGQACFGLDDSTLFVTGYEELPNGQKLGIVWCTNRPVGIYKLELQFPSAENSGSDIIDVSVKRLTPPERSCRSPRVLTTVEKPCLIWISNTIGGPHASCCQLHVLNLTTTEEPRVLVATVQEPVSVDGFPGLYIDQLHTYTCHIRHSDCG